MAVTKVVMTKLSEAMETGKIIKWLKKEGDRVQGGDILAEIETDKADVEMEAFGAGVLRKILVQAGDRAPVGALIGVIAEADEDIGVVIASALAPTAVAAAQPASSAMPAGAGVASVAQKTPRPPQATPRPADAPPTLRPAPAPPPVAAAAPASPPTPASRRVEA